MTTRRIAAAGALIAGSLAITAGGAVAQTAGVVDKPLSLLPPVEQPHPVKAASHLRRPARVAKRATVKETKEPRKEAKETAVKETAVKETTVKVARRTAHRAHRLAERAAPQAEPAPRVAARETKLAAQQPPAPAAEPPQATVPATTPAFANVWPDHAGGAAAAGLIAPAPQNLPAPEAQGPGQVTVDGQTVEIDSADDMNELDVAADQKIDDAGAAAKPQSAAPADPAPGPAADADSQAMSQAKSQAMSAAADPTPSAQALIVHHDASRLGSASWIAEMLAALGGAVAAGIVAWFLVGPMRRQSYDLPQD